MTPSKSMHILRVVTSKTRESFCIPLVLHCGRHSAGWLVIGSYMRNCLCCFCDGIGVDCGHTNKAMHAASVGCATDSVWILLHNAKRPCLRVQASTRPCCMATLKLAFPGSDRLET